MRERTLNMISRYQNHSQKSHPTIRDVARAAGVSTATVSNVLRSTRFVGADLQQRVKDAIAALGYSPNFLAAGLRERKSRLIVNG
jgi:LacI family transcriptional regulator, galactose operon repressor